MSGESPAADSYSQLYGAVGHLVVRWTLAESTINSIIAIIYQSAGGKEVDPSIPVSFGRKIKFLRRCFKRIKSLERFSENALLIINSIRDHGEIRNWVVHGFPSHVDGDSGHYILDVVETDTTDVWTGRRR